MSVPNYKKARERSVNNLQRLYVIVVSLGITFFLKNLIEVVNNAGILNLAGYYSYLFLFVSFIFIVIPFFHGANRYLDSTYVIDERSGKSYGLLIDFLALFLQGLILFVLSQVASVSVEAFYITLAILLFVDIVWVGLTYFTANNEQEYKPGFKKWALINTIAIFLILLILYSNLLISKDIVKNLFLLMIVIARTIFDYVIVWNFYYPQTPQTALIPAPLPAQPPKREKSSED